MINLFKTRLQSSTRHLEAIIGSRKEKCWQTQKWNTSLLLGQYTGSSFLGS